MYLPKINKKIASYLLGGGVVVSLAAAGGLKIQDSINYQAQVRRYAKVKSKFSEKVRYVMPKWYLPTWQNEAIWKRQHERYMSDIQNKEKFVKQFPTSTSFRDYCYGKVEKEDLLDCDSSKGWCMDCSRDPDWDNGLPKELLQ